MSELGPQTIWVTPHAPALVLAPMDGLTDAPMRAVQGEAGAFTHAVSEFLRVNADVPPKKVFHRDIPELLNGGRTHTGLPVQVQLLGGDAERMAEAAVIGCKAGARAIDINFGCPAPTVNRHDGGATLLKYPQRIREIVAAIRAALPPEIPVSAKLRLGWDTIESIHENAAMAAEGGAAWITIHGRTKIEGYKPPAHWGPIGEVRARLGIPVVANGDIWSLEAFKRCQDETGCAHFMLGRGALADPTLSYQIAAELGLVPPRPAYLNDVPLDWIAQLQRLVHWTDHFEGPSSRKILPRMKQWLNLARRHGDFQAFDEVKRAESVEELFAILRAYTPISSEASKSFAVIS
ncbi:tRNA-dihydrouridine(16) synthase [Capsulimonas corticalis]|uniref:tRNA-dihydrouridine synthase n=1 Tax=Capsulimonas corticalis TaxID=2219043 RepID=A0A402CU09_9BACT|nr:tRNA-dihydrouridine synthase family protein [Capsulimonas corticalis]BDI28798.1 tRNA-dihydrouridine(16) synthase [Capsulimonas corticalis]